MADTNTSSTTKAVAEKNEAPVAEQRRIFTTTIDDAVATAAVTARLSPKTIAEQRAGRKTLKIHNPDFKE